MLQRVGGAIGASVLLVALGSPSIAYGSPVVTSPLLQKAPSPSPSSSGSGNPNLGPATAGSAVCTMSDPQLTEVSGIVATTTGYAVINDSNVERSREKIFFLDGSCVVTRAVGYPSSAFDPEDLAIAEDGTLWVADVGDNTTLTGGSGNRRSSIALWSLAPGSNTPVIHRLAYPDGHARDAEALLIDGEGHPVIITKDPVGEVYTLKEPVPANNANPASLTRAGSFRPQATGTANPYGILGTGVVTGAAMSPDGKRAVVRTMSDAYEFDITDGDLVEAITGGSTPRITPLPNEPQGEGIAYSRDGTEFLTTSDQAKPSPILRYTPYAPPAPAAPSPVAQAQAPKTVDRSFLDSLSLRDLTRIVTGIGVIGVLMIAVGVFAVIRSRRRRRALLVTGGVPSAAGAQAASPSDAAASSSDGSPSPDGDTGATEALSAADSDAASGSAPEDGSPAAPRSAPPAGPVSADSVPLTRSPASDDAGVLSQRGTPAPSAGSSSAEPAAGEPSAAPVPANAVSITQGVADATVVAPATPASPQTWEPVAAPRPAEATKSSKRPRSAGGSKPSGSA